jgi:hypothetical protein
MDCELGRLSGSEDDAQAPSGGSARASRPAPTRKPHAVTTPGEKVSDQIDLWLRDDRPKTVDSLIEMFGDGSFAILFVLLMALPALPLPTGGATHVLEVITMMLSLELVAGRRRVWLPRRWRRVELAGTSRQRLIEKLLAGIRRLERFSRPRGRWLLRHRLSGIVFGLVVFALTLAAFLAPPFSGLDTLPSIGVVMLALGFLMLDAALAAAGLVVGVLGITAVVGLGSLVANALGGLF